MNKKKQKFIVLDGKGRTLTFEKTDCGYYVGNETEFKTLEAAKKACKEALKYVDESKFLRIVQLVGEVIAVPTEATISEILF